jgi:predicted amidophosphoribosyltransferase
MAYLDDHLVNPPDLHAGGEIVACLTCGHDYELPAECCPNCGAPVDEDSVRDAAEHACEDPAWH